ncbi:MAG: Crp/Fnr family transcriptional regulator [Roseiflexaceae bacterium]|nr:Crp/Fnr family transcriptional regulator [Roseiflexaceae bacterium]
MAMQLKEALRRVGFCAQLPEEVLVALAHIAVRLQRVAGSIIQIEGEPATAMYIVISGRVKIARVAIGGREQVLYVVGPGAHFNTVPIFDGGNCPANAEALTDVELLMLPHDLMRTVVEAQPKLALALLAEFTGRLRHLIELVDDLALHTVQGRVAGLLLAQAEAAERGEQAILLTQAEMAARIGTVREMIGRTLRTFEGLGLITLDRGTIFITDRMGLAREAEG